jgi:hypothetical protein
MSKVTYIHLKCGHVTSTEDQELDHSVARLLPGGKVPSTRLLFCDVCEGWYPDPRNIKRKPLPEEPMFLGE